MSIVFSDPFTTGVTQALTAHNPDYTMLMDSDANLQVVSGSGRLAGSGFGGPALAILDAGPGSLSGDYRVGATLGTDEGYSGHIGVRGSLTSGGQGYFLRIRTVTDEIQLYRIDDGVANIIDSWSRVFAQPDSVAVTMKVEGSGATVTITVVVGADAPHVTNDSSASRKTSGYPIVGSYRETGATGGVFADNFTVDDLVEGTAPGDHDGYIGAAAPAPGPVLVVYG